MGITRLGEAYTAAEDQLCNMALALVQSAAKAPLSLAPDQRIETLAATLSSKPSLFQKSNGPGGANASRSVNGSKAMRRGIANMSPSSRGTLDRGATKLTGAAGHGRGVHGAVCDLGLHATSDRRRDYYRSTTND